MEKIGLFYGSSTGNSELIARMIKSCFQPLKVDTFDVLKTPASLLDNYNLLIFGISTWDLNSLHEDWSDFISGINSGDFQGKSIALYGLGDQLAYANSFVDSMGHLYTKMVDTGARLVGSWSTKGYSFTKSAALVNDKFVGLAIDEETQSDLTRGRVKLWVDLLKQEFYS